jgi:AcrR family transcriptional regulator
MGDVAVPQPGGTKPKAAERIQSAAKDLFYRQGIRATGIEEVCRAADATKMSLYRSFPSKDALVAAVLCEDAATYDAWFAEVTAGAETPAAKLRAMVEAGAAKVALGAERGCPMLLAQAEFPDPEHPTHRLVAQCKAQMRAGMVELARAAGAEPPELLADTLALLFDGAWASSSYLGSERAAAVLRQGATSVLDAVLPPA